MDVPSAAVILTVTVFEPSNHAAAEPLLIIFVSVPSVSFTIISIAAPASAGVAVIVFVAFDVSAV